MQWTRADDSQSVSIERGVKSIKILNQFPGDFCQVLDWLLFWNAIRAWESNEAKTGVKMSGIPRRDVNDRTGQQLIKKAKNKGKR